MIERDGLPERAPALEIRLLVADLDAALGAVEDRRRDDPVAVVGEAIGDPPDMRVDAEDLLDDDQPAPHDPEDGVFS